MNKIRVVFVTFSFFVYIANIPLVQSADESQYSLSQKVKELDKRLEKIEKFLNNQILSETLTRIDELQSELSLLRGDVETINYKMESVAKRNKNLYLDTDRRLQDLERRTGNTDTTNTTPSSNIKILPETANIENPTKFNNTQESKATKTEKDEYIKAFDYLKEGRYQKSISVFSQFLEKYPNGHYADNAQYWLAESNYVSHSFEAAINEFNKVINLYPTSPKVADARLKLGYCYYETGNWQKAKDSFKNIIKDYPETSISHLANKRLKKMKEEGR